MAIIKKLILHNFKKFKSLNLALNEDINIFVGDNESGKTTILQAIDFVVRGSHHKVEDYGIDKLFNTEAIASFYDRGKQYSELPVLFAELYLDEQNNPDLSGRNNSLGESCDGLLMRIVPDEDYSPQIRNILDSESNTFPFEFYKIEFCTFQGSIYSGRKHYVRDVFIDNSMIGSEYAMAEFVKDIFSSNITDVERYQARWQYRENKNTFEVNALHRYSDRLERYSLAIKNTPKNNLDADLTIKADGIPIENKGTGSQCFIKTRLALSRGSGDIDVVLMEEPENHLSHMNMSSLIEMILASTGKQLFIATHNDLISTRLDLRKCFLLNSHSDAPISLSGISENTAKFFMKAPDNNMLRFILSNKVILVEGDAEFILMDAMCNRVLSKSLKAAGIDVISVDGKCFKRYIEIASVLGIKTAIVTDNDEDYQKRIVENYQGYDNTSYPKVSIFSDENDTNYTFEVCMYNANQSICETLFSADRRSLSVLEYMLCNKAEAAYQLLIQKSEEIAAPEYIENALRWIDE